MTGILIDANTGDLLVQNATIVIGQTDSQTTQHILMANRGEYKEHPLLGAELPQHLGGPLPDRIWKSRVRSMLRYAGVNTSRILIDGQQITIL